MMSQKVMVPLSAWFWILPPSVSLFYKRLQTGNKATHSSCYFFLKFAFSVSLLANGASSVAQSKRDNIAARWFTNIFQIFPNLQPLTLHASNCIPQGAVVKKKREKEEVGFILHWKPFSFLRWESISCAP